MHTSDVPSTFNTSHTSHTSHTSPTSQTSHTSHKSHISHTSSHKSKHHVTILTPTTPVFAVATLPCSRDDELHALENNSEDASLFCPVYLGYKSQILLPTYLTQFGRPQIRSACSCFDTGHYAGKKTASAVSTEADLLLTSMAPSTAIESTNPSSSSSSESSISTTSGSVILGKTSSSASFPSPGRCAAILLLMFVMIPVVVPMMALLNDV